MKLLFGMNIKLTMNDAQIVKSWYLGRRVDIEVSDVGRHEGNLIKCFIWLGVTVAQMPDWAVKLIAQS
jgi:hypothetical protein